MAEDTDTARRPLRAWREEAGISQFTLAVKAGVSQSTIVNIEHDRQIPNVNIAQQIAQALGVTVMDIAWPTDQTLKSRTKKDEMAVA